ncbi:heavy metal-associated isoprenylated plant protein 35 [Euphorbia lathyris]|uniref:heavy metal-associated isoprenylated plant protein 35 n=1 Tax=Euphorbia lathyris TaxID=212925 RepID=UPI003313EE78
MGRLGKILEYLCVSSSCLCINNLENEEKEEFLIKPLIGGSDKSQQLLRLKDVVSTNQTLAFHLKPKMVVLKVSIHCIGCARKVEKHVSKLEGVTSYKVDLESKTVVVIGDIIPLQVLESVSKLKYAQLWNSSSF